jgi:alpha-glucosidase
VARQHRDPTSALALVRAALPLRRTCWRGRPAELSWRDAPADCLAFRRGADGPTCLVNLGAGPVGWRPYGDRVLLTSGAAETGTLPPRSTAWLA